MRCRMGMLWGKMPSSYRERVDRPWAIVQNLSLRVALQPGSMDQIPTSLPL